jgi:hypothetical protein
MVKQRSVHFRNRILNKRSIPLHFTAEYNIKLIKSARFQVLTATSIKKAVFWDVAQCILVYIGRRFRGAYCLHHALSSLACILQIIGRNSMLILTKHGKCCHYIVMECDSLDPNTGIAKMASHLAWRTRESPLTHTH